MLEVPALTPEAQALADRLRAMDSGILLGRRGERVYPLSTAELVRFYAQEKEVLAENAAGEAFVLKQRLYELEELLAGSGFVRISHAEIINLRQVAALDLKLSGTIRMTMKGGAVCYASRRYVKKIREVLGL